MELRDLVGVHLMTGIETGTVKRENWWSGEDNCNYVKFRLDGVTYMVKFEKVVDFINFDIKEES